MPSSTTQSHARSHALLLLQKLLNLRDSASPLTLVLDTLEQSGKPILREFTRRAQISKTKIIYISFATPAKPAGIDVFVRARGKSAESLRTEIVSHYPSGHTHKTLIIIDELNPLASNIPSNLALFLSSLITSPSLSLVGLYHTDVPLSQSLPPSHPYTPHPLTTLTYLATAILRVSNLHHAIAAQRAHNRSLRAPDFGLGEGREGVLVGLGLRNGKVATTTATTIGGSGGGGLVLEMELRRRSGRAVGETFVLVPSPTHTPPSNSNTSTTTTTTTKSPPPSQAQTPKPETAPSKIFLLAEHPVFLDPEATSGGSGGGVGSTEGEDSPESTFNLGLTEKQRRDREGIVLPYFDAQTDIGAGEGGRILYDMGREDDFDDEEDEI
ncbi:Elongator complex protein 5 [Astrocystis sublimbata]|nr:Elongator complex protein 5 [Astrocystis sublimbata]